jgi:hypothetical protein
LDRGYVPLDERHGNTSEASAPDLLTGSHGNTSEASAPDLLTGPEHGLVKCCNFKTTCNGSRQLSIEHSSPDRWDTAALDSANCS